ncbi:MAG: hypothetical protein L0Y57_12380 [Beijerinckiaceae bacterium]|nr:hypothetical protein [Beijerinckiaceae bacterium]
MSVELTELHPWGRPKTKRALPMVFWSGLLLLALGSAAVQAQSGTSGGGDRAARHKAEGLLNENYLTSTGQTVPNPGVSQGAPTSPLDRRIERRDDGIDQSICSNCN